MILRVCKCGTTASSVKELQFFVTASDAKHGRRNTCKQCAATKSAEHRQLLGKEKLKAYKQKYYQNNKETDNERSKRFRKLNPDYCKTYNDAYYQMNAEQIKKNVKRYQQENKDRLRDRCRATRKAYRKSTHGKAIRNAACAKRRATKLNATPSWLTQEQKQDIKDYYKLAAIYTEATGFAWHVDHVYPLQGETSCGLHVPWNLQVIPASINLTKGNKLPTT